MKIIVRVDERFAIGKNGDLLYPLAPDMKFFRETTKGKVVIMGRKTLDSFPGGRPLQGRVNIVLTANAEFKRDGTLICHSVGEVLRLIKNYNSDDCYVIGGGQVYRELEPYCDTALVTKVFASSEADSFFFDIDSAEDWKPEHQSDILEYNGIRYAFCTYKRVNLKQEE